MSYTNQDQFNTTGAPTQGAFDKTTTGQFGSNNPSDTSSTTTGDNAFGQSRDPNTFSNVGSTGAYGSGNTQSQSQTQSSDYTDTGRGVGDDGLHNMGRTGLGSTADDNLGSTGFGGGGTTVGGTNMYGAKSESRRDRDRDFDDQQQGYTPGTGTGAGQSYDDQNKTGGSDVYGNYTGDAGVTNAPPEGFRGGANDPAYQPGQRYEHKAGGLVSDDGSGIGRMGMATGHNMPGRTTGGTNDDSTYSGTTGTGFGSNDNDRSYSGTGTGAGTGYRSTGGFDDTSRDTATGTETGYGSGTGTGLGSGTGTGAGYGSTGGFDDQSRDTSTGTGTGYGTGTGTGLGSGTGTGTGYGSGMSNTITTKANLTSGTGSALSAGQQVNVSGGGEGWQSGTTGLTEEEIKQLRKGRHAPGAVEAHPNPNTMDNYDV